MKKNINLPKHIAIILDGNGRYAKRRGLPRSFGHYRGGMNLVDIASYTNKIGIQMLTVYAFSTENWKRPEDEVKFLMSKPIEMIHDNLEKFKSSTIKVLFKGRRDRIPKSLLETIEMLEDLTKDHEGMILNICFDYGSYDELLRAVQLSKEITCDAITSNLMIPTPVDLLIRTGGEYRLSNFMLWQISYAELYFTKVLWPAFNQRHLNKALKVYSKRHRRFGGL